MDIALFSAGGDVSRDYAPLASAAGATVVDNSSAFRMADGVPLVVPEVNADAMKGMKAGKGGIIANPNCSTIIALVAVTPLHRKSPIQRMVVSTYQAASGAGAAAMEELKEQTREVLAGKPPTLNIFKQQVSLSPRGPDQPAPSACGCDEPHCVNYVWTSELPPWGGGEVTHADSQSWALSQRNRTAAASGGAAAQPRLARCGGAFAHVHMQHADSPTSCARPQYAFNLFSHTTKVGDNGYNEEEMKMVKETRKIWGVRSTLVQACPISHRMRRAFLLSHSARLGAHRKVHAACVSLALRTMIVSLTNYRPELRRLRPPLVTPVTCTTLTQHGAHTRACDCARLAPGSWGSALSSPRPTTRAGDRHPDLGDVHPRPRHARPRGEHQPDVQGGAVRG